MVQVRKPPPPFVPVTVTEVAAVNPRLMSVRFHGEGLAQMNPPEPAASIRLLVPSAPDGSLEIPEWKGNEFLLAGGERPAIRTFTPLRFDAAAASIELEVVRHEGGTVSDWAQRCAVGDPAALSGPQAGWQVPSDAREILVFGDETALPAISQLLGVIADDHSDISCTIHVEVLDPEARRDLDPHGPAVVHWHVADSAREPLAVLVDAATAIDSIGERTHIWAAGEAAAVQAMRKHFLRGLGVPRDRASIRGYWKSR